MNKLHVACGLHPLHYFTISSLVKDKKALPYKRVFFCLAINVSRLSAFFVITSFRRWLPCCTTAVARKTDVADSFCLSYRKRSTKSSRRASQAGIRRIKRFGRSSTPASFLCKTRKTPISAAMPSITITTSFTDRKWLCNADGKGEGGRRRRFGPLTFLSLFFFPRTHARMHTHAAAGACKAPYRTETSSCGKRRTTTSCLPL